MKRGGKEAKLKDDKGGNRKVKHCLFSFTDKFHHRVGVSKHTWLRAVSTQCVIACILSRTRTGRALAGALSRPDRGFDTTLPSQTGPSR